MAKEKPTDQVKPDKASKAPPYISSKKFAKKLRQELTRYVA